MIITKEASKAQNPKFFHNKIHSKLVIEQNVLNLIKGIYKKSTAIIVFNVKRLKTFSLRPGIRQRFHSHHFQSTLY